MYLIVFQAHTLNSTRAQISCPWSITGILGPFVLSVFLFCYPFRGRDTLKKTKDSRRYCLPSLPSFWDLLLYLFSWSVILLGDVIPSKNVFLDGCCSTVQGLRDWFEVDLRFSEVVFRLIGVLSIFLSPTLSSRSPVVLLGDVMPSKIERSTEILVQATPSRSCSRLMSEKQLQMQVLSPENLFFSPEKLFFSPENLFFSPSHTGSLFRKRENTQVSFTGKRSCRRVLLQSL